MTAVEAHPAPNRDNDASSDVGGAAVRFAREFCCVTIPIIACEEILYVPRRRKRIMQSHTRSRYLPSRPSHRIHLALVRRLLRTPPCVVEFRVQRDAFMLIHIAAHCPAAAAFTPLPYGSHTPATVARSNYITTELVGEDSPVNLTHVCAVAKSPRAQPTPLFNGFFTSQRTRYFKINTHSAHK